MPKLPANLPENWTQGQTISPNGTETGLTEQHGYNYLMKQVNNTQTEVNNINGALPDVAQQATVEKINNKIGEESDAGTQPTLFGRLAKVLKAVLGIDTKIGTSGDTAGTATLFGQVKDISKKMPTGTVKSVQRGTGTSPEGSWNEIKIINIQINTVNPEKCFVIINTAVTGDTDNSFGMGCYVKKLTSTQLTLGVIRAIEYSWQVIECF